MNDIKTNNLWLMKGDCLERMKEIPDGSVDLILTDPPYGTTACKWDSVIVVQTSRSINMIVYGLKRKGQDLPLAANNHLESMKIFQCFILNNLFIIARGRS